MKLTKREKEGNGRLTRMGRPWSPFWQLSQLEDEFFTRFFDRPFGPWFGPAASLFGGWAPEVDTYEDKDNVIVKAELPGMKKEDIEVSVSGDVLYISGERKQEEKHEGAQNLRVERYVGRFQRGIPLRVQVQGDKIHAEYKDGILTITCSKTEEAKRKHIDVKVQ